MNPMGSRLNNNRKSLSRSFSLISFFLFDTEREIEIQRFGEHACRGACFNNQRVWGLFIYLDTKWREQGRALNEQLYHLVV